METPSESGYFFPLHPVNRGINGGNYKNGNKN